MKIHVYDERLDYASATRTFIINDVDERFTHLERDGWSYSAARGRWETLFTPVAYRASERATPTDLARRVLERYYVFKSMVDPKQFDWPMFEHPLQFQLRAATFALARNRSYLAVDPGLGKTIIAALINNHSPGRTLIVAPSFLKLNWRRELLKWDTNGLDASDIALVRSGEDMRDVSPLSPVVILPDSLMSNAHVLKTVHSFKKEGRRPFDRFFRDEGHRDKTLTSQRTLAILGGYRETAGGRKYVRGIESLAKSVVYLSGTPMPNRPFELWPVLFSQCAGLIDFLPAHEFGMKYCGGRKKTERVWSNVDQKWIEREYGYEYRGSSNAEELAERIHDKYLLRITKDEVADELPAKRREIILIDPKLPKKVVEFSRAFMQEDPADIIEKARAEYRKKRGHTSANDWARSEDAILGEFSVIRKELGITKIKPALEIIGERLETTDEKLVVFAYHRTVVEVIAEKMKRFGARMIHGGVPADERDAIQKIFTEDDDCRLVVINTRSGGTGLNLQVASRALFVEVDWVPEELRQCEDRIQRLGSAHDSVLCEYLVVADSFDEVMLNSVLKKTETIQTIINKGDPR